MCSKSSRSARSSVSSRVRRRARLRGACIRTRARVRMLAGRLAHTSADNHTLRVHTSALNVKPNDTRIPQVHTSDTTLQVHTSTDANPPPHPPPTTTTTIVITTGTNHADETCLSQSGTLPKWTTQSKDNRIDIIRSLLHAIRILRVLNRSRQGGGGLVVCSVHVSRLLFYLSCIWDVGVDLYLDVCVKSDILAPTRDRTRRVADRMEVLAVHGSAESSLRAFLLFC